MRIHACRSCDGPKEKGKDGKSKKRTDSGQGEGRSGGKSRLHNRCPAMKMFTHVHNAYLYM